MNEEVNKSFQRLAEKLGWMDEGGLEAAERKLMNTIGKKRHEGTSTEFKKPVQIESSDEDFDHFLLKMCTPKKKTQKQRGAAKMESPRVVVLSSEDEGTFEAFLEKVKTPTMKLSKSQSGSEDSLKKFIVDDYSSGDDFVTPKPTFKVPKKLKTPASTCSKRKPLTQLNTPVFLSDSEEDEDNIVIKSTWRTRFLKPKPQKTITNPKEESDEENRPPSPPQSPIPVYVPPSKTPTPTAIPKRHMSAPTRLDESSSSEEEFASLLDRLKKKNNLFSPKSIKGSTNVPSISATPVGAFKKPGSDPVQKKPEPIKTPGMSLIGTLKISQSEPRPKPRPAPISRVVCKTPGCFLDSLSNPSSSYVSNFKKSKEELTSKLYELYNTSIFESKLPTNMPITWNKKMRKTAGYCITGKERGGGSRYARIELSDKVCDSADRLRDTLIHEMCHAATWLINDVRDGHGNFWKLYARKATLVHPELPMVTRCHTYDITYKFQYQCMRCQNTIGRHSKSLDTEKFVCAYCKGRLTLLTPSKPRPPTPFANFVKENYGSTRQKLSGQSHADIMRKLSADFASKTKLSSS